MALTLELSTTPGTITGDVNYYELAGGGSYSYQPNPILAAPANPNPVHIHDDQPWIVQLENLTQNGAIFAGLGACTWHFRVILEQLGMGEFNPGHFEINFPLNPVPSYTYPTQVINIAAGAVPEGEYHVYASLKLRDGINQTPISGVAQLGTILQIIDA